MKKRIGYVFLILISIIGSRLIFGKDYHLNSANLVDTNLYLYDIFDQKNVNLAMIEDEFLYYTLSNNSKRPEYIIVKYNLISNKIVNEYKFNTNYILQDIKMFKEGNNIYFTAINSNIFYVFNNNLELIDEKIVSDVYDSYGILGNQLITTLNNQVFINDKLSTTLPNSCGNNKEIIYNKSAYLHFYNINTGFGCLYDINTKKIEYLDYSKSDIVNNRLLEYQDNRISFKYDNNIYYFNDITESDNLKMHDNGDYLFTINTSNDTLKVYNLETKKIIYNRTLLELNGCDIKDILIDDYVYFTVVKDNITKLYIWDYLKESRSNKNMISYDEKEYKFKNNELKEEIKDKYNIDIYIYDQAVLYFPNYFVIPSYDDILINSRLNILKDALLTMNSFELDNLTNTKICFEKSIMNIDATNNYSIIKMSKNNLTYIAIDITNDNFKTILIDNINITGDIIDFSN